MQTIISTTTVIIFGLLFSCGVDKPNTTFSKVRNEVIDKADILTVKQEDSVSQVIKRLRNDIGSEIAVLTIDSLGDKSLEAFSLRIADSLKLGRVTHNDGLLITISLFDRKARIEVGTGLENIINDEIAAEIMREDMAPNFRKENYGQGIYIAVSRIDKLIRDNEKLVFKITYGPGSSVGPGRAKHFASLHLLALLLPPRLMHWPLGTIIYEKTHTIFLDNVANCL